MTEVADLGNTIRFYDNALLSFIRTFKPVQIINDSGRCFCDGKSFVVFDGPVGFNIDGDTFFQWSGTDRSYPG